MRNNKVISVQCQLPLILLTFKQLVLFPLSYFFVFFFSLAVSAADFDRWVWDKMKPPEGSVICVWLLIVWIQLFCRLRGRWRCDPSATGRQKHLGVCHNFTTNLTRSIINIFLVLVLVLSSIRPGFQSRLLQPGFDSVPHVRSLSPIKLFWFWLWLSHKAEDLGYIKYGFVFLSLMSIPPCALDSLYWKRVLTAGIMLWSQGEGNKAVKPV